MNPPRLSPFHIKELVFVTRIPTPFQRRSEGTQAFAVSLFLKEAINAK